MNKLVTVVAVGSMLFTSVASADNSRVTARSYVQRNILAHWDGINNQGKDADGNILAHNASATTWIDLVGGRTFALTGTINWQNGKSFKFNGSTYGLMDSTGAAATFTKVATKGVAEYAITLAGSKQCVVKSAGNFGFMNYSSGGFYSQFRNNTVPTWNIGTSGTKTVAAVYSGSTVNGVYRNVANKNASKCGKGGNDSIGQYTVGNGTLLGCRSGSTSSVSIKEPFKGSLFALRLYSETLSVEELAINYAIDRVRFYGVTADIDTIMPDGWGIGDDGLICHLYQGSCSLTPTVSYSDYAVKFADGANVGMTALPAAGASAMTVTGKGVTVKGALTFTLPEIDLHAGTYSLVKAGSITLDEGAEITVVDPLQQCFCTPVVTETEISVELKLKPVRAQWIGGTEGAVDDPASWTCWDKYGDVLEDQLPIADTVVTLPDGCAKGFPAGAGFLAREVMPSATLGGTCDWRGFDAARLGSDSAIDLQGHDLYLTLGETPMNYVTFSNSTATASTVHLAVPDGVTVSLNAWTFGENVQWVNDGPGIVIACLPPAYAKCTNGVLAYYDADMVLVAAPKGGLTNTISLAFADAAEFQALAALPAAERARAKNVVLLNDVVMATDTDWSAFDFDLNGHVITLKGCRFKVSSLLGEGIITSTGSLIANGDFTADPIPAGSTHTASLLPKGWKGSANVIAKNDSSYCGHQMNGTTWFCIGKNASISQTFRVAKAGSYKLLYSTASKNTTSSASYSTLSSLIDGVAQVTHSNQGWVNYNYGNKVDKTITLTEGLHTFSFKCTQNNAIVRAAQLYPADNYVNKTSVLEVCVPEGVATTNSAVLFAGGASMRVEKTGAGSLTMAAVNDGFGAANAIAGWESVVVKEGTLCKTANGATIGTQYARVKVEDGGQVDIGGRSYWDYDYDLCGAGPDGSGALVNTTSVTQPWAASKTGYLRHLMLSGDAMVGGTQNWGMTFYDYSANTATMNGHTLTYAGTLIYGGLLSYSGTGGLVIDEGATVEFCTKTPTAGDVDLEVRGTLQQHDYALSPVKSLRFTATGTFNNPYATRPTFVVRTDYAPNTNMTASSTAKHPTVQLGAAGYLETTLDLSSFTNAFDGASTTFFAGSFVTVDLGARELAVGEKIVSWSTAPAEGVQFLLAGDNVAPYQLGREADGLYINGVPTFATINPSTGEWAFFGANGDPYPGVWEAGVTDEIEVRFSSLAEFEAIKAAAVTPSRYVLTSLALTEPTDMTGGFPFLTAHHLTIDLKGQTLKLPAETVRDSFDLTIIDTTGGYDYLDAITSSGTQYIDTGFTCSQETRIDASFNTLTRTQNYAMFFGVTSNDSKDDGIGLRYMSDADQTLSAWFCAGANISAATGMWNKDVTATLAKSTLIINGVSYPFTTTKTPYQKPLYLFCGNNGGSAWRHQAMKLYSFKMTEAGVVVRDFVPVRRHRDNAVGLLDRVNNVFYANKGSGAFTAGTVTDVVAAGELVLDVAAGQTVSLGAESATVLGEVKLVKVGAGTLVTGKAQTYVGGTDVRAGTLKYGVYPGAAGSPVTVYEGGVFDLGGNASVSARPVLAGGTLVNSTKDAGNGLAQNAVLSVVSNSTVNLAYSAGLIGSSYAATTLDLGGNELDVTVASGKSFWLYNTAVTAGTLKLSGAGTLAIDKTNVRAAEADFDLGCAKVTVAVATEVHDWIVRESTAVSGNGVVTINGAYKPIGDSGANYAFKDGATLDLSERNSALDLTGKNVTFADGATITVKSPRCIGRVVRWTTPANLDTLTFVLAPGERGILQVTDEGIFIRRSMVLIVR